MWLAVTSLGYTSPAFGNKVTALLYQEGLLTCWWQVWIPSLYETWNNIPSSRKSHKYGIHSLVSKLTSFLFYTWPFFEVAVWTLRGGGGKKYYCNKQENAGDQFVIQLHALLWDKTNLKYFHCNNHTSLKVNKDTFWVIAGFFWFDFWKVFFWRFGFLFVVSLGFFKCLSCNWPYGQREITCKWLHDLPYMEPTRKSTCSFFQYRLVDRASLKILS